MTENLFIIIYFRTYYLNYFKNKWKQIKFQFGKAKQKFLTPSGLSEAVLIFISSVLSEFDQRRFSMNNQCSYHSNESWPMASHFTARIWSPPPNNQYSILNTDCSSSSYKLFLPSLLVPNKIVQAYWVRLIWQWGWRVRRERKKGRWSFCFSSVYTEILLQVFFLQTFSSKEKKKKFRIFHLLPQLIDFVFLVYH